MDRNRRPTLMQVLTAIQPTDSKLASLRYEACSEAVLVFFVSSGNYNSEVSLINFHMLNVAKEVMFSPMSVCLSVC